MIGALTALAYTLHRTGPAQEVSSDTRCQQCGHLSTAGLGICAECRTANAPVLANNSNTSTLLYGGTASVPPTTDYRNLATPTE